MLKKLLSTPTEHLGKASRFMVFQIKLWSHCVRLLRTNRADQQAAALAYHTIFGLVPLAIVMLLIFQMFPAYSDVGDKLKNFIYKQAHFTAFKSPATDSQEGSQSVALTEHLDKIVDKFFTETNKGTITLFSVLLVIWAAINLLSTIEKAFNNIWNVGRGRNLLHRVINYWAVLTLGPLFIGAGIYAATKYAAIERIQQSVLSSIGSVVFSYLVAVIVLFLLYYIMPNTRIKAGPAIWGAAAAALVWVAAKNVYGYCVTELDLYSSLYGVLALVPITVLWIFITWVIVMFGLQLTFTTQHLKSLDAAEILKAHRREEYFIANDITAINMVREITSAFEKDNAPLSAEVIYSKLNIPPEFGEKLLNKLVDNQIIAKTSDPRIGFTPAKDPEHIKLSDIAEIVTNVSFAQKTVDRQETLEQIAQLQKSTLSQYNVRQIIS